MGAVLVDKERAETLASVWTELGCAEMGVRRCFFTCDETRCECKFVNLTRLANFALGGPALDRARFLSTALAAAPCHGGNVETAR